jgi:anti-anti-sigma regulatory factor
MKVKIDTKEIFHVVSILEPILSANMTDEVTQQLLLFLKKNIKNVVLRMTDVKEVDKIIAGNLVDIEEQFYDNGASFVICELTPPVEKYFDELELLELMNVTKTESEAWDITQMEEIERELE